MLDDILRLFEQIRKSAITGKNFAANPYDETRYSEILSLIEQFSKTLCIEDINKIDPVDSLGYITPKVGVNGIAEDLDGKILLEKRNDDLSWGIPGGWAEVGLTAEENLKKEIAEETGYEVNVEKLIGVMSRKPSSKFPFTSYHLVYQCSIASGDLMKSYESERVEWKDIDSIDMWHFDHHEWIKQYFNQKTSLS